MRRSVEAPRIATETSAMRICIVTTAHLCNNPRVVKEADALHEAGHDVRVVSYDRWPEFAALDREMMHDRGWRHVPVSLGAQGAARIGWLLRGAIGRMATEAYRHGLRAGAVRDWALNKYGTLMASAATREPADLVIAHHAHALPAAALAARKLSARLAFDAEDLHAEDFAPAAASLQEKALIADVERTYLPRCDRLTASSEPIAIELANRYAVPAPAVVLNVFPVSERPAVARSDETDRIPSMYWFSQVIGANRGIEEAVEAMAILDRPVRLTLRGTLDRSFGGTLQSLTARYGLTDRVRILPRVAPRDLVASAMEHDIGLALEQAVSLNRDLCVTNKIFVYMLGGLAIAATNTRGQRSVLASAPGAGAVYEAGNARALAELLDRWLASPALLAEAKAASLTAATTRFCWELERDHLVGYLTSGTPALDTRVSVAATEVFAT